jgi:AdoMet-dependent heme synthase
VLKREWLERLKVADAGSLYSLEFRVSIDGPTPEINDPIRGERTFERAMRGVEFLSEFGFLPIITMTRTWEESEDEPIMGRFRRVLKEHGCLRPRLKILPRLKIGAEALRTAGYHPLERVTAELMAGYDQSQLICNHSRVITDKGVYVCPILLDAPEARLGDTLKEANRDFPMAHGACFTCYLYGAICTNPSAKVFDA